MAFYTTVVLSPDPVYLQTESYSAQDDRRPLRDLFSEGVLGTGDFLVAVSAGMTLSVAVGAAYIKGLNLTELGSTNQGMYRQNNIVVRNITVGAAHATLPRLDQIILRVMDSTHDTGGANEGRIEVIPGTATSGATLDNRNGAADLTALQEGSKNVLLLCDVLVPAAAGSLVAGNLRDRRAKAIVGGGNALVGFHPIADRILLADAASIDITNISQRYFSLLLIVHSRGTQAATTVEVNLRFNGDSGSTYDTQFASAGGTVVNASESFAGTSMALFRMPAASAAANLFGGGYALIPQYADATANKFVYSYGGDKIGVATGNMTIRLRASAWRSNASVNQITLTPGAANFLAGARVVLFGLAGL